MMPNEFQDQLEIDDLHKTIVALLADLEAVAVALVEWGVHPEHDCPGDTPEQVGWICLMCKEFAEEKADIQHDDKCALARPGVKALLERVEDG